MLNFLENQILFYASIILTLFLPGYFLLLGIFGKQKLFSIWEKIVISVTTSILIVNFLMLGMHRLGILLDRGSILSAIIIFSLACFGIHKFVSRKNNFNEEAETEKLFSFSRQQAWMIVGIVFLTLFVRVTFLANNILPSATDLGHHMYWSKAIAITGSIPEYSMREIESVNGSYQISEAKNISDFIVGEHLIFSAIAILSGLDFLTYFPIIVLFFINTISLLAIFVLALRFFQNHSQAKNIAILALFLLGPLFAISPPQAKYIAGGVVGNIIGNLLLPISLYFFYRALKEQNKVFAVLAIFVTMGLFYTHHLTGLILLFVLLFSILLSIILNLRNVWDLCRRWLKLFVSWPVVIFFIFVLIFLFGVHMPSYLKNAAVKTVVSDPSKTDHAGLLFSEFKSILGEPREALGIVGLALMLWFLYKRKNGAGLNYAYIFLVCWAMTIAILALFPTWVQINIPSGRVGNYGVFSFSLLSAFVIVETIRRLKNNGNKKSKPLLPNNLLYFFVIIICSFVITFGLYDNAQNKIKNTNSQKILQTFDATSYLQKNVNRDDRILKDHIYTVANAWMKLYFMRDYNFPFYRANLERYANNIDKKEFCTLWMISTPATADSQKCFDDLKINFVMVNKIDAPQFEKIPAFEQIYTNGEISIFYRPQNN